MNVSCRTSRSIQTAGDAVGWGPTEARLQSGGDNRHHSMPAPADATAVPERNVTQRETPGLQG